MYIGKQIKGRMSLRGISAGKLAEASFLDEDTLESILADRIPLEHIDEFDLSLICNALGCSLEVLLGEKSDILSFPSPLDTMQSLQKKAQLARFVEDFGFVTSVMQEANPAGIPS